MEARRAGLSGGKNRRDGDGRQPKSTAHGGAEVPASRLARNGDRLPRWGAGGILGPLFERFTERSRQVVVLAQEEARTLKHGHIGTEHVLLGLLGEHDGVPAQVLESFDITLERTRGEVVRIVGVGQETPSGQIPFTPRGTRDCTQRPSRSETLAWPLART